MSSSDNRVRDGRRADGLSASMCGVLPVLLLLLTRAAESCGAKTTLFFVLIEIFLM